MADGGTRAYHYGFRVQLAYRGSGVGTELLRRVEQDLRERHFGWVTLNVSQQNLEAQRFYQRYGYQIVAAETGRWSYLDHLEKQCEVDEPAWRMQKRLQ